MSRSSILLFGLLGLWACPKSRPEPRPGGPLPTAADALASLRAKGKARSSMRTLGRMTYFGEEGRVRLKVLMLLRRPASFRFETISPFEQPIDVMTSDGAQVWLLSERRLQVGMATPENIARLTPLALEAEELVDTLLGGVPISSRFHASTLVSNEDGHWLLSLEGPSGERMELEVDPGPMDVRGIRVLDAAGEERLRARFEDFEPSGDSAEAIPRTLKLVMADRNLDVELRLKEVEVNVPMDDALFRIEPPPGVTPEPMRLPVD